MTELTTAPDGAPLAAGDIFLVRKDGEEGVKRISAEDAKEFFAAGGGGGGDASYPPFEDNAGKVLAVNADEDGVEWIVAGSGGGGGGGSVGGFTMISRTVLSVNQNQIVIADLPQDFEDLIYVITGESDRSNAEVGDVMIMLNDDAGNSWDYHGWTQYGGGQNYDIATPGVGWVSGPNRLNNNFPIEGVLFGYSRNDIFTGLKGSGILRDGNNNYFMRHINAQWRNLTPVQKITFFTNNGNNFTPGTVVTIYGRGGTAIGSGGGGGGGSGTPWYFNPPKAADLPEPMGQASANIIMFDDPDVGLVLERTGAATARAGWGKPIAGSWTAIIRLDVTMIAFGGSAAGGGIVIGNAARDKFFEFGPDNRHLFEIARFNNGGFDGWEHSIGVPGELPPFIRVRYDAATGVATYGMSMNGKFYVEYGDRNVKADFGGGDPAFIGLAMRTEGYQWKITGAFQMFEVIPN